MSSERTEETGKIRGIVAAHIEPVTRFDGSDLSEAGPEKTYAVPLVLNLGQEVSFSTETYQGASSLSHSVDKVVGQIAFSSELQGRLSRAHRDAPQALQAWANANPASYRRVMPAGSAFLRHPGMVGYEYTCTTCSGNRKVTCPSCSGAGRTNCYSCFGSGKINCHSCGGSHQVSCSSCGGRGNWTEQVSQQTWSYSTNSYVTSYQTVYHNCSACYGSGRTNCHSCGYDGKITCNTCFGSGQLNCSPCGSTGRIDCSACQASGMQHTWGTVKAKVEHAEKMAVLTDDEHLRELIESRLDRAELPAFGALDEVVHSVEGNVILTRHKLHLDVREARVIAGDESFLLHGFGPDSKVFDFQNIAGHLLTDDLDRLEKCVASASPWRRHRGTELLDTTADFLRSELNLMIAERVADLKAAPEEAGDSVEKHFAGLVDSDYVSRATRALRGAVARLYGSQLLEPAASLCGLAALTAGVLYAIGWPEPGAGPAALYGLGGGILGWFGLEWLTRRRIARHFEGDFGKRVIGQLRSNGSIMRWRFGMAVALLAATILAVRVTGALPPIQAHHQEVAAMAESDRLLSVWFGPQAPSDLRQRQYPAHAVLLKKAEAGDQRALVVLTWQLLLGAGNTPKDVAEAGRWLDKAAENIKTTPLWKAAKAVHTINQDAMPADIRMAAQRLGESAGQGIVEARYWLARTYLAEQSPLYDARQGLQALTLAADRQHAHAALLLGTKFAKGEGVRRDIISARRYLTAAAAAGLPEATATLGQLR